MALFTFVNLTMNGTDQSYTIPDDAGSIAIQAQGGAVDMYLVSSGAKWTLNQAVPEVFNTRVMSGQTFIFKAEAPATVQIRIMSGILS